MTSEVMNREDGRVPLSSRWLAAYDDQLRTDAETPSALSVTRHGPLRLVTFAGGRGFVTYRDLGGLDADGIRGLVPAALDHYRADPEIDRVEWKTRGHDHAPGLHQALTEHGFVADEPESIMVGETRALAVDVSLPDGVTLRTVTVRVETPLTKRGVEWIGSTSVNRSTPVPVVAQPVKDSGPKRPQATNAASER